MVAAAVSWELYQQFVGSVKVASFVLKIADRVTDKFLTLHSPICGASNLVFCELSERGGECLYTCKLKFTWIQLIDTFQKYSN